ncbi:MAG TPA: hypothetical protein PKC87_02820 [Candidatus Absconditabacterales bacterium]|nr:hypothetical protein [Candidatus Absconditabacterales bacterium]
MIKNIERRLNNRLVDFVIGGSYLNDYRTRVFEKTKKTVREAYEHILVQYERFKERYRN